MTASIVILLLVIAIGLVLLEIFIVPGVGIPGIVGAVLMIIALVFAYDVGTTFGHYTLGFTAIATVMLFALAFRSRTWDRLSLKSDIGGHVIRAVDGLKPGDQGTAISRINPMGKAMFHDRYFEVSSKGDYIDAHTPIEIINIEGTKIIVRELIKS